jgi:tripartite ATP-independent transporter DctM subunit
MALTILVLSFAALLVLGVPVAFAIGLSAAAALLVEGMPLAVLFQRMVSGMNIFSFLAIPFFIFAGEIMLYGGVAERIVRFAKSLTGHVRGGLGMSNVVSCTLFGGVSGSPVADVSAMGAVMIPMMKKEGYHADYAVNVTTHSALVGALMPTSHNMVIYAFAAGGAVSISSLIMAGVVPAMVLTLCMLLAAYLVAVKRKYAAGTFPGWGEVALSFGIAMPGLLIAVIILAGILSGIFTATEAASVAVLYALILTVFVYKSMTWEHLMKSAAKAVKTTGVVLLLIGISAVFQHLISLYEVAELTGQLMSSISSSPWAILPDDQRDLVPAGHLHGHGQHDPDLHSDLFADCDEVRHGPGPVRDAHADQLRAGPEHATGGDHPVRRLRHRRHHRRPGHENHLAVLWRFARRHVPGDLCARLLPLAAHPDAEINRPGSRPRVKRRSAGGGRSLAWTWAGAAGAPLTPGDCEPASKFFVHSLQ